MVTQLHQTTSEQDAHQRLRESVQRIVLEETQGCRRIVRSVVSIMEGDAPSSTPWHQLEAAKLLLKLGFEDAQATLGSIHKQGRKDAPKSQEPPLPLGEGWGEGDPQQSNINPEQVKLNKKLVRQIRVDTGDGTSMVKFLIDVVEGNEPAARVRDRIEAAKVLLHLCFDNPAQPDPEFMMYYAPCHPDCLCVCKDLPEDHPGSRTGAHPSHRRAARAVGKGGGDDGARSGIGGAESGTESQGRQGLETPAVPLPGYS